MADGESLSSTVARVGAWDPRAGAPPAGSAPGIWGVGEGGVAHPEAIGTGSDTHGQQYSGLVSERSVYPDDPDEEIIGEGDAGELLPGGDDPEPSYPTRHSVRLATGGEVDRATRFGATAGRVVAAFREALAAGSPGYTSSVVSAPAPTLGGSSMTSALVPAANRPSTPANNSESKNPGLIAGYYGRRDLTKAPDPVDLSAFRPQVAREAIVLARELLRPVVARSPMAAIVTQEAGISALSGFDRESRDAERVSFVGMKHQPNRAADSRNSQLRALGDAVVEEAVAEILPPVDHTAAAQGLLDSLNVSPAAEDRPLEYHTFTGSGEDVLYVDALDFAKVFKAEAHRDGLILGQGAEVLSVKRASGDAHETIARLDFVVQDRQDPDITYLVAVQPGLMHMTGSEEMGLALDETGMPSSWHTGYLKLTVQAVHARNFQRRAVNTLLPPEGAIVMDNGEGRVHDSNYVTVFSRTAPEEVFEWMTRPDQIGLAVGPELPGSAISTADNQRVVDAELVD